MKILTFLFIICFCISCSTSNTSEIIDNNSTNGLACFTTDISISKADNVVIADAINPITWKGSYNDDSVTISFTRHVSADGETETKAFIFNKTTDCLTKNRAYKFYNGENVDVSAVTAMDLSELYIKEWVNNKKLSGLLVYTDPHNKITYSRKFYVEFTLDDFQAEFTNFTIFEACIGANLPIEIDMNSDGITDFKLTYDQEDDIGNTPKFKKYTIELETTSIYKNKILSPIKNQEPYLIVHEPPFSSENKIHYPSGVKNALDIFYEYEAPYQNFNYFLDNTLTYGSTLNNNKEDYFIISMALNNLTYYGWIRFNLKTSNCNVEVLDTYLNANANEHVSVN